MNQGWCQMRRTRYDEFLDMQAQETDDCILWPYAKVPDGYGQVRVNGAVWQTHRLSCEIWYGSPPTPHHEVAHSCRNRHCFNPKHLRWATRTENQLDRIADGTHNRGERCGQSKITEDDVRLIRYEVGRGTPQAVFARHFGLATRTVSMIVRRETWAWLPDHQPREVPRDAG